jgi:transcriptional regulator with XRE-family HTH domain
MMSKIENGVISASLATLQGLSQALGVPLTSLLRRLEEKRDAVFVKAGAGVNVERRGTRADQHLLGHIRFSSSAV